MREGKQIFLRVHPLDLQVFFPSGPVSLGGWLQPSQFSELSEVVKVGSAMSEDSDA